MSTTQEVTIPPAAMNAFDSMFAAAPEPQRGKRFEAGTYQAQFQGMEIRTLPQQRKDGEGNLSILTVKLHIIGPPEFVDEHPLDNEHTPGWFLVDEKSLKAVKALFRSLGIKANTLTEALAEAAGLANSLWEISVTHRPKGADRPGEVYENTYFNRRLDS